MHRNLTRAALIAVLTMLFAGATAAAALAAPVTVDLRIEGSAVTHFEGPVTTDVRTVDGHDGTGAHTCDGTNNGQGGAPAPTSGTTVADASDAGAFSWHANFNAGFDDYFIDAFNGEMPDYATTNTFWSYYMNGQSASTGICQTRVSPGDDVLFAVANGSEQLLALGGPFEARPGESFDVAVTDAGTGAGVPGASVGGQTTGATGRATLRFDDRGDHALKATRPDAIRSNRLVVCVHDGDDGACTPRAPVVPAGCVHEGDDGRCGTLDRRAPGARIAGIRDGTRFAPGRGPRLLSGSVTPDPSGIADVKLRLKRRAHARCHYFSGRSEKLRRTPCSKAYWFRIGPSASWSYLLPAPLPSGRYVLDVTAIDGTANRDRLLQRGRTRVVFTVG